MLVTDRKGLSSLVPVLLLALISTLAGCSSTPTQGAQKQYAFWPPAPDQPRVQFLISFRRSSDIRGSQSKFDEMVYGKEPELPIASPYSVVMRNGRIYVCDVRGVGLTILDLKAKVTKVLGASGAGEVSKAVDIALADDGTKYVIDGNRNDIVVFDATDRFVRRITQDNFNPLSVAVYGNELFVSDFRGACVKVLDRNTGAFLRQIGEAGPEDGKFVRPLSCRIDAHGNVVVADMLKCRIQTFSRDGKFLHAHGQTGLRPGDFVRPKHMGIDKNNFLYVTDAAFNNVQIFDEERKILMFFGSIGEHVGAMDLPAGLFVDEDPADVALFNRYIHPAFQAERLVLVTNQHGSDKVAVYAQGQLKPGKTIADVSGSRANVDPGVNRDGPTTRPVAPPIQENGGSSSNNVEVPGAAPTTRPAGGTTGGR